MTGFTGVGGLLPGSVLCGLGDILFVVWATMVLVLGWVCLLRFGVMCGFGFRCCLRLWGLWLMICWLDYDGWFWGGIVLVLGWFWDGLCFLGLGFGGDLCLAVVWVFLVVY